MSHAERVSIMVPGEIADTIREAVQTGDYASADDAVRSALQDWRVKRARRSDARMALRADIVTGLADVVAERVLDFDPARIIERGRELSSKR